MIDAALRIMERFGPLLPLSDGTCEQRFTELIDPIYGDAQSVFQDYTSRHLDLIEQLFTHQDVYEVIKWLETQRLDLLPLRMQVRTLPPEYSISEQNGNFALGKFQHGILGLIWGCAAWVEEQAVPLDAYGYSGPSLLGQLYATSQEPLPLYRGVYVDTAKRHFQAVERAWEDAVEGYATIKYQYQEHQKRMARAARS